LISNFLFRDLIENFPDFRRKSRLLVELSPIPHSMGDNVYVPIDGKFLSFKGIGVHHQYQASLSCSLPDGRKDVPRAEKVPPIEFWP
jgi:hypothetical protein